MFSSPPPTWMFRFGGFAPTLRGCRALARRVSPFGHPRIHGCSRLPAEYRRLPRPSSPPGATGIPRAPSLACRSCLVIARLLDYYYSIARFCVFLLGDARAPPPLGHPSRGTSVLFVSSFLPSCQRTGAGTPSRLMPGTGASTPAPGASTVSATPAAAPPPGVVPGRLELPAPTLSVWCSNRLSYGTPARPYTAPSPQACRGQHWNPLSGPLQKGGVPAAPSGTATLLRLSPSHRARPRQG